MKSSIHSSLIGSIIRNSGVVAEDKPSVNHPIAVSLFYRANPDGSICWIWPKGSRQADLVSLIDSKAAKNKWVGKAQRVLFTLGLVSVFSHGQLVLYTDVPTATYLQNQWKMNAQA